MSAGRANAHRGEVDLPLEGDVRLLRPSFEALVAAEAEAGSLFRLLDRAAAGEVRLSDMDAMFWHCLGDRRSGERREAFQASLVTEGICALLPVYRALLSAVFRAAG